MAPQREWLETDFYSELGVAPDASADEIKKAYRKLARELHPDANPGDAAAEERFKKVSEAHSVLADPEKRKEYDETRAMFAGGRFRGGAGSGFPGGFNGDGGYSGGGYSTGGFGGGGGAQDFNVEDLFGDGASAGNFGDLFGGLFNRTGGGGTTRSSASRPRRGNDLETETTLPFREAALGTTKTISLSGAAPCTNCHGSGARPGTSPRVCPTCNGAGVVSRNQGAFGFSEPCPDCHGTGSKIDEPCPVCDGNGATVRTRSINVRVPAGVEDGQRIRLAGQGEAGLRGAPSGDLYVVIHVTADPVFTRKGYDLKVEVPVSFSELALGATLSVPTLEGRVGVKVPAGTSDGRTLRVRGRGVPKRAGGTGDLLVTVKVAVPSGLDEAATEALTAYATAEKAAGFDPRASWAGAR